MEVHNHFPALCDIPYSDIIMAGCNPHFRFVKAFSPLMASLIITNIISNNRFVTVTGKICLEILQVENML